MATYIVMKLEKLLQATDMLRYDGAFSVEIHERPEGFVAEVGLTHFTPERWASFGVNPLEAIQQPTNANFEAACAEQAAGFVHALRFVQACHRAALKSARVKAYLTDTFVEG